MAGNSGNRISQETIDDIHKKYPSIGNLTKEMVDCEFLGGVMREIIIQELRASGKSTARRRNDHQIPPDVSNAQVFEEYEKLKYIMVWSH